MNKNTTPLTGCLSSSPTVRFTLLRADRPISKQFWVDAGTLKSETLGTISRGHHYRYDVMLDWLPAFIAELTPCDAIISGTNGVAQGLLASRRVKATDPIYAEAQTRTKDTFVHEAGQSGLLIIDYDPNPAGEPLSREQLVEALVSACPAIGTAGHVWSVSSSSCVQINGREDTSRGIRGQRLYFAVADAADIPRVLEVLHKRLWLAGHGWILVAVDGSLHERSPVDRMLRSPVQPDFIGGPELLDGVVRLAPAVEYVAGDVLDTREL